MNNQDQERPRTRWRRGDDRPLTRNLTEDEDQSQDNRPISRRGDTTKSRPMSIVRQGSQLSGKLSGEGRPITQGVMRPPSAIALRGTGLKPVGTGVSGGLSQRQVQDRSYYMGLIRTVMNEVTAEITKLRSQSEEMRNEKAAALVYEKRVRELAEELTGLQENLSDCNSVIDRLNTGAEVSDVNLEISDINKECESLNTHVEKLFQNKQTLEGEANKLREQLKQEQQITEKLVRQLPIEEQGKFADLQRQTTILDAQAEQFQAQIEAMNKEKAELEDQISDSDIHQDLLRLKRRLKELKTRRNTLAEEERTRLSPGQQRDALLASVKAHNAELAALEAQIEREKQSISTLQSNIHHLQQNMEQCGSERQSQYTELKKRESAMEEFLSTFESAMTEEKNRRQELEQEVVTALSKCSSLLVQTQQLPSIEHYSDIKEQLGMKEGEVERAKFTSQGLSQQESQLKLQMQRVSELEEKVSKEMTMLRNKMSGMESEMTKLSDIQSLKDKEDNRRKDLENQKNIMNKEKENALKELKQIQEKYSKAQHALNENELWAQLSHLEQKWSLIVQNNHALSEHIEIRKSQGNFQPVKEKAMDLILKHNQILKEMLINNQHH